jgi:predicted aspartyl protease
MGVRVRVMIESSRSSVETSALVNTGFETPNPQILLPVKAAEKLGL